ncbi:MAG: Uma2 family endonuclease [Pseudobdellovibrionaceae bacterium]
MNSSAPKEKTAYEKWMELPNNVVGEIIMGDLHVSPRPTPKHGNAASSLLGEIMGPFHKGKGGPGGWLIMIEPEIHLESNITVPDIAGWRRERMPQVPEEAFFSLAPDWICEVLSPSTAGLDRAKKMPLYAHQGVKHFWLVDPITKTLEVYKNDHALWTLVHTYMNNEKVCAVPFDAIEFDLSTLWS